MSEYYTAQRTKNLYDPKGSKPFRLSRSRIELYKSCPRCFYIDRRLGVDRPPMFPYTLNSAVDKLLKKEFDLLREKAQPHELMKKYGIDAIPAKHPELNDWRNAFKGLQYLHEPTNLLVFGAIDDLWQTPDGEYIIVDYKSTAKDGEIIALDKQWHDSYKRQMEIYQWIMRRNGYKVAQTGYFVYCNGRVGADKFDGKLEFDLTIIGHKGSDGWVEDTVRAIRACLDGDIIPPAAKGCDYCDYREAADKAAEVRVPGLEG